MDNYIGIDIGYKNLAITMLKVKEKELYFYVINIDKLFPGQDHVFGISRTITELINLHQLTKSKTKVYIEKQVKHAAKNMCLMYCVRSAFYANGFPEPSIVLKCPPQAFKKIGSYERRKETSVEETCAALLFFPQLVEKFEIEKVDDMADSFMFIYNNSKTHPILQSLEKVFVNYKPRTLKEFENADEFFYTPEDITEDD